MAFAVNPPNGAMVDSAGRPTPEWYRFFANLQRLLGGDLIDQLQDAPYITAENSAVLRNERVLSASPPIAVNFSPDTAEVSLLPSGVNEGSYGSDSDLVQITFDESGRAIGATSYPLISDNVQEGSSNLFFTQARARASLSATTPILYDPLAGDFSLDVVPATFGGTGFSSYLAGDMIYASSATSLARLGIGPDGSVLTSDGSLPSWTASTGTGSIVRATRPQFADTIGAGTPAASSGSGVTFPATQSPSSDPNTLDDYEEGTWSPTVSSITGALVSYSANGTYTKIGRLITCSSDVSITDNGTGSGAIRITLPFAAGSAMCVGSGRERAATGKMLQVIASSGAGYVDVLNYDNTYPAGTGYQMTVTITYFA